MTITKTDPAQDNEGVHPSDPDFELARVWSDMEQSARSDAEMTGVILSVLEADECVPEAVNVAVRHGSVTLQGQVTWGFERDAAERAIRKLLGGIYVRNSISLRPRVSPTQVSELVLAALRRHTPDDAKSIQVDTAGSVVTLSGYASTWQSIMDAENAAWAAPGVAQVLDMVRFSPKALG